MYEAGTLCEGSDGTRVEHGALDDLCRDEAVMRARGQNPLRKSDPL